MELVNLLLTKNSKVQSKFNSCYANNEMDRKILPKTLLTSKDVLNIDKIETADEDNSNKRLLDVLFKTVSIELKPIYEGDDISDIDYKEKVKEENEEKVVHKKKKSSKKKKKPTEE